MVTTRPGFWLALLALAAGSLAVPAGAVVCGLDESPAATLLLPYFEVDLANPQGRTTLFSINNASSAAILTNVTLWTDLGVPTVNFQVYLTGLDVQTVNLRDILAGQLPRTASVGQDPTDTISPQGPQSQDLDFASCSTLPHPDSVPQGLLEQLRAAHTGRPYGNGRLCAGQLFGDGLARGYVTIDTVSRCATSFPSDPGYFGPGGVATSQNVLWGDFYLIDNANNFAMGDNLVRLEADPAAFHAGDLTFYGRFVGYNGADAREPLPNAWATRYLDGGAFSGGTELLVWRDSGAVNGPFLCATRPSWFPLNLSDLVIFDEEETLDRLDTQVGTPDPGSHLTYIPAETNRLGIGDDIPFPFQFGWAAIDFGKESTQRFPSQAYVTTLMKANGRFMVGFGATPLLDACGTNDPQLPLPGQ